MTDLKDKLAACPFCGGKAKQVKQYDIYCIVCGDCAGMSGFSKDLQQAIDAWNKRYE